MRFFVFLSLFISLTHLSLAQKSKAQLEREKKQNLKKIAETNKILQETAGEKKASLGQLTVIKEQISSRQSLISSINREIYLLDREVTELDAISSAIEAELTDLKSEYAAMVYASAKANTHYGLLTFLFSASTFNQLFTRLNYLKQYTDARKLQAKQIEKVKAALAGQRDKRNAKRYEKQLLLQSQVVENKSLLVLRTRQDQVVQQLSAKEEELKTELEESRRTVERVEKLITDLVEKEIRKTTRSNEGNAIRLTPEGVSAANSFEESRNKLMWPVQSGFISGKFGKQPHPVLKGIVINNDGVTIQTNKGEAVRVVYDGVVQTVATIPGINKLVAVQHGDYFTVYSRLINVSVKAGQRVKAKDVIGEVLTDPDGTSEMGFQIWKNYDKLNPESWLFDK